MTASAKQREQARRFARAAVRRGRPATDCPYDPTGTPTQRSLALAFTREYLRLTKDATNYDDAERD
jgi:hypothetical protein